MSKQYSVDEVAFVFGVSRQTIYNWMERYGVEKPWTGDDIRKLIEIRQSEVDEEQALVERARARFHMVGNEPVTLTSRAQPSTM